MTDDTQAGRPWIDHIDFVILKQLSETPIPSVQSLSDDPKILKTMEWRLLLRNLMRSTVSEERDWLFSLREPRAASGGRIRDPRPGTHGTTAGSRPCGPRSGGRLTYRRAWSALCMKSSSSSNPVAVQQVSFVRRVSDVLRMFKWRFDASVTFDRLFRLTFHCDRNSQIPENLRRLRLRKLCTYRTKLMALLFGEETMVVRKSASPKWLRRVWRINRYGSRSHPQASSQQIAWELTKNGGWREMHKTWNFRRALFSMLHWGWKWLAWWRKKRDYIKIA
jgi:hypothetical protein